VNAALVQALPVMTPAMPGTVRPSSSATSASVADTAARDHRDAEGGGAAAEPFDVGTDEHAVAGDVGDDERRDAAVGNQPSASNRSHAAALRPAVHGELAVAVVEPDGDGDDGCDASATSAGSRTAAEPITTRLTPASASTVGVGDGAHAAAGLHPARPSTAARWPRPRRTVGGEPLRAASRSTTWIHGAPARRTTRRPGHRVVAVRGLAVVVALQQAHHRPPRRSIAGYSSIMAPSAHAATAQARRTKLRSSASPIVSRLLGVELGGEHVAAGTQR
jgi:hypothetical protein